jgi:hypothetical protein
VVFGQVTKGYSVVKAIEAVGSMGGGTAHPVLVADCGVCSAEGVVEDEGGGAVRKRPFLRHLYIKCIILPRQARDKHRENLQKWPFSAGWPASQQPLILLYRYIVTRVCTRTHGVDARASRMEIASYATLLC